MKDFARALLEVWPEATKAQAGVLWAHFAGETGDGKYCWNWNLGNVKHVQGDGFDYVALAGVWEGFKVGDEDDDGDVDEVDRALFLARLERSGMWTRDPSPDHARAVGPLKLSVLATKGNPATWFKSYASLEEGMRAFVDAKRRPGGRYSSAWQFVLAGNPEEYGRELGRKGYYTASQDAYARSMRAKFTQWEQSSAFDEVLRALATVPAPEESDHDVADFDIVHASPFDEA